MKDKIAYKLRNWAVQSDNCFLAPECQTKYLCGNIYGRNEPRPFDGKIFDDGKLVYTSRIVTVEGRFITTSSGSVYELEGPPHVDYVMWCKENGFEIDPENPIKIRD